jgi:predicted transposase YbfD/YdcC
MECSTFVEQMQLPTNPAVVEVQSVYGALQRVPDQRCKRGQRYSAAVVLTLMLLAKLAGEKTMSGIAVWVRLRAGWVREQLPFKDERLPCANTYQYVCDHVAVAELTQFLGDLFACRGDVGSQAGGADEPAVALVTGACPAAADAAERLVHLALDGKSLRGTRRVASAKAAAQVVGLYNVTKQAMVRQCAMTSKGQERAAAFALLDGLDLSGCVVSADALHTQPRWCRTILAQHGHYLVLAKRNQAELRRAIALLFSQPPRPALFPERQARTVEKQHGRLEIRQLRTSAELGEYLAPHWPSVAQVFQVERIVTRQGKTTQDLAYGMTSLPTTRLPAEALLTLIRHHWHIENRSHWRRDVTLGEDACRVTLGQTPQVLATLNNTVLALVDRLRLPTLATAIRQFAAQPATALALLLSPV